MRKFQVEIVNQQGERWTRTLSAGDILAADLRDFVRSDAQGAGGIASDVLAYMRHNATRGRS